MEEALNLSSDRLLDADGALHIALCDTASSGRASDMTHTRKRGMEDSTIISVCSVCPCSGSDTEDIDCSCERILNEETMVRSKASQCVICVWKSDSVIGFSASTRSYPESSHLTYSTEQSPS